MNFLELCRTFASEAGISNAGPDTVDGQLGEFALVVRWVRQAYIDIQNRHGGRWRWLRREFTLQTVPDQRVYTYDACVDEDGPVTRFRSWDLNDWEDPPKIYRLVDGPRGETYLSWLDHHIFRGVHEIGSTRVNSTMPVHITVDDQDRIVLGPIPNDEFTVTGHYYRSGQTLTGDTDVPEMPADYHFLIVLYALEHYGFRYVAQESLERAFRQGRRMLRQLEATQAPRIRLCGPLA